MPVAPLEGTNAALRQKKSGNLGTKAIASRKHLHAWRVVPPAMEDNLCIVTERFNNFAYVIEHMAAQGRPEIYTFQNFAAQEPSRCDQPTPMSHEIWNRWCQSATNRYRMACASPRIHRFSGGYSLEPIDNTSAIPSFRWNLACMNAWRYF
jgi:hypothetical protein